jgi:hypothetical protein
MKLISKRKKDFTFNIAKITILYITIKLDYIRVFLFKLINKINKKRRNN